MRNLTNTSKLIILLAWRVVLLSAYDYQLVFQNEEIITRCKDYPDNFMDIYTNFEELQYERLENDSIHVKGQLRMKQDIPNPFRGEMQVYKYIRGQWVNTVYTYKRENGCAAIFSPLEYWHIVIKDVPAENRKCPILANFTADLDFLADITVKNYPDRSTEGEYKLEFKLLPNEPNVFACFEIFVNLYRV